MNDLVLKNISSVFSLSSEEAAIFLDLMSTDIVQFPSPTYMIDILNKFPSPVYHKNIEKPVQENELNINTSNKSNARGEFGYIYTNRSRSYIYKFYKEAILPTTPNKYIQGLLTEPLINVILQNDPIVRSSICKIFKIYCEKDTRGYTLLYKLEELGPTLYTLDKFLLKSTDFQLNKRILLKTYGPIYRVLQYLRKTYTFEHGDLHSKNILFVKSPFKKDGTLSESRLQTKLIDFGLSGLIFNEKLYGGNDPFPGVIKEEVRHLFFSTLPSEFKEQIQSIVTKNPGAREAAIKKYMEIEKFVIEEATKLNTPQGGKRTLTRKIKKH